MYPKVLKKYRGLNGLKDQGTMSTSKQQEQGANGEPALISKGERGFRGHCSRQKPNKLAFQNMLQDLRLRRWPWLKKKRK